MRQRPRSHEDRYFSWVVQFEDQWSDSYQSFTDQLESQLKKLVQQFHNVSNSVTARFEEAIPAAFNATVEAVHGLTQSASISLFSNVIPEVQTLTSLFSNAISQARSLFRVLDRQGSKALDLLVDKVNGLRDLWGEMTDKRGVQGFASFVLDKVGGVIDKLKGQVKGLFRSTTDIEPAVPEMTGRGARMRWEAEAGAGVQRQLATGGGPERPDGPKKLVEKEQISLLDTLVGSAKKLTGWFDNLFGAVGPLRIIMEVLAPVGQLFHDMLLPVMLPLQMIFMEIAMESMPLFAKAANIVQEAVLRLMPPLMEVVKWLIAVVDVVMEWKPLIPIVTGIIGALIGLKVVVTIINAAVAVWNALSVAIAVAQGVVGAFSAVWGVLNALFVATPIGWIILAVGGLVAGIVILLKKLGLLKDTLKILGKVILYGTPIGWLILGVKKAVEMFKEWREGTLDIAENWKKFGKILLYSTPIGWLILGVKKAVEMFKEWREGTGSLGERFKAFGKIVMYTTPIGWLIIGIRKMIEMFQTLGDKTGWLGKMFRGLGKVILYGTPIGWLILSVMKVKDLLTATGDKSKRLGKIFKTLGRIIKYGTPIGWLITAFQHWGDVVDEMGEKILKFGNLVKTVFTGVARVAKWVFERIQTLVSGVIKGLTKAAGVGLRIIKKVGGLFHRGEEREERTSPEGTREVQQVGPREQRPNQIRVEKQVNEGDIANPIINALQETNERLQETILESARLTSSEKRRMELLVLGLG